MKEFHEFIGFDGQPVSVRLSCIAKWAPAKPHPVYPNMRTILTLFNGEEGFVAISEDYEIVTYIICGNN